MNCTMNDAQLTVDNNQCTLDNAQRMTDNAQHTPDNGEGTTGSGQPAVDSGLPTVASGQPTATTGQFTVASDQPVVVSGRQPAAGAPTLDRSVQPPLVRPQQIDVQQPERSQMPNGVPLVVLRAGESEVTRIDLLIDGGRYRQTAPLQALFTNRMLREGTRQFTSQQIAEKLDYYGAWLELSISAEHALITLYSLNKYLPQTLPVLESMVKEPTFPEQELRTVVDSNARRFLVNCSRVDFLAHRALLRTLFGPEHPCGRLATHEDYSRITPDLLRQCFARYYHSRNLTVYLSGRVTDSCLVAVERILGSTPFGEGFLVPEQHDYTPHTSQARRTFVERADAMQSAVRMGLLTIPRRHPDFLRLRVLITLLGGYFGSRLMSNIREDKGYTYGITADLVPHPGGSMLVIGSETTNEWVEPLIAEVYHEVDRLHNDLVPEAELTMVQNYMTGEMCRNYESPLSLADAWLYVQMSDLPDTYFADALQAVRDITPEEIRHLARTYLHREQLREVVAGRKIS